MTSLPDGSRLAFLGPDGTFTHQAALAWAHAGVEQVALRTVAEVYAAVAAGEVSHGVVAIENSVEGYVVPSLDAIVAAENAVAVDEGFVPITFDAFVRPGGGPEPVEVTSHPHGLAQCQGFIEALGLTPVAATSNAAACRDIRPGQLALGPRICGELYGLDTWATAVEDFHGARTRFLLLASRDAAVEQLDVRAADGAGQSWRTMLAVTPHLTGPGVLARITDTFGSAGVNMSSFITRPLKALEARYVFILTVDGAPWSTEVGGALRALLLAGDSVKTLGVFPSRGELEEIVDERRVPVGSVRHGGDELVARRGLLWS